MSLKHEQTTSSRYKETLKALCEKSHEWFMRVHFKARTGQRFILNQHHRVLSDTLDRVYSGEIKRLVINIPPGYTKTESAIIQFVLKGLAMNPRALFLHVSYADTLVKTNSATIKDMGMTEQFQEFWPMEYRKDSKAKGQWYNTKGGGIYCSPFGGPITGFRAGRMEGGFSGALLIDDPIKPGDVYSDVKRAKANNYITDTLIPSRLAHPDVPVIMIMQRLHEDDPSGYVLRGGTGEKWHHLILPAIVPEAYIYPQERYTHGIHIPHNMKPGPLWRYKMDEERAEALKNSSLYVYCSQYDQDPANLAGGIFKDEWWQYYKILPELEYRFITVDTAQKTKTSNDYTVFACWGRAGNKLYLTDILRGKWESPDLRRNLVDFWNKHKHSTSTVGKCRGVWVEDKVSGTGLIQDIQRDYDIPISGIDRRVDKVTRAMDTCPYVQSGYVVLPDDAYFVHDFKEECRRFNSLNTQLHDDMVDTLMDAIELEFSSIHETSYTF